MLGLKLHVYNIQLVSIAGQSLNPAGATFLHSFSPPCVYAMLICYAITSGHLDEEMLHL